MNTTAKKQLINGAHEAQEVVGDFKENLSEAGHLAYESGKKVVHDIADAGTKAVHHLAESGKDKIKDYASEGRNQLISVEDYISQHPVKSVLISAAAGYFLNKFIKN